MLYLLTLVVYFELISGNISNNIKLEEDFYGRIN
ncbi:hypothetical protein JOD29_000595 [Lysinibacillus composti]|nr:hypothetical protein [Lysinibacillus composti]